MNSAPARTYEPASVMPGQTIQCIRDLQTFYMITGNKKFLNGIPDAIEWLESSYLPDNHKSNKDVTHATFYELGTNKHLYAHREGTSIETGRYWVDYEPRNFPGHYGLQGRRDMAAVKREYERVNALTPEEAMAEYNRKKSDLRRANKVDASGIEKLIDSLDNRGAWVEELSIPDYLDVVNNPRRILQGIDTETYIKNMSALIGYLQSLK